MISTGAQADAYRWVDANGVTVYSQTPPADSTAEKITPPPPPAEDPDEVQRQLDAEMQQLEDYREDKALAADEGKKQAEKRRIMDDNCSRAKANLENLTVVRQRLARQPDGSYVPIDENERQARMAQARHDIDKNCK
jgi:hypothetical protein